MLIKIAFRGHIRIFLVHIATTCTNLLIFSILSLVTVAMVWSPRKELKIRGNADNLLERYDTSDIIEYSGCYINQSGQICINGVDPHIVFKKENIKNVTTIVIKLKDKI